MHRPYRGEGSRHNYFTFDVTALDDDIVSEFNSVDFIAYAENYTNGTCWILVEDNDMPNLTMRLTPTTISEAAGPSAIMGVITRDKTNSDITISLSDNSIRGDLYYSTKRITLKRGQSKAEFTIGIVDNQLKEGDRDEELSFGIREIAPDNFLARVKKENGVAAANFELKFAPITEE